MMITAEEKYRFAGQHRSLELQAYEHHKSSLSAKDREILEKAISQCYLVLPQSKTADEVKYTYEKWCNANKQPTIVINPNRGKHHVHIRMYENTTFGGFELRLNLKDETFQLMMLLCREYTYSEGHVHIDSVPKENAEIVARELLAFHDRSVKVWQKEVVSEK